MSTCILTIPEKTYTTRTWTRRDLPWDPAIQTLTITGTVTLPRLPYWVRFAKYKVPIPGLRKLNCNRCYGCRQPTPGCPCMSLRYVFVWVNRWDTKKPKRRPGESWREWRRRVKDWKVVRVRVKGFAPVPYIYGQAGSSKGCGEKFPKHLIPREWIVQRPGEYPFKLMIDYGEGKILWSLNGESEVWIGLSFAEVQPGDISAGVNSWSAAGYLEITSEATYEVT